MASTCRLTERGAVDTWRPAIMECEMAEAGHAHHEVPYCYFLPRRSLPSAFEIYGAVCDAGVGARMMVEVWIRKRSKVQSCI